MNRRHYGSRKAPILFRLGAAGRAARLGLVVLVTLIALLGCAEDPLPRLGSIPTPLPGSIEIPQDVLPFDRAAVVDSLQSSVGATAVDVRMYLIPLDIAFQTLESHYHSFLNDGWKAQETPAMAAAQAKGRAAVLWSNVETGEILSLQYMPAPDYDGNLLIVLYASKEKTQTPGTHAPNPA